MQPQDEISRHPPARSMPGRVAAVILAAGLSSRMGSLKPLLPLGRATVLEQAVGLCMSAGVEQVVVVTGHQAGLLRPLAQRLGARAVFNPLYQQGMFASVLAGVQALEPGTRAFFLLPVDMPLVRPATLLGLARAWLAGGARAAHPCFLGRRGHPPLLDASLIPGLLAWQGQDGLRGYLASLDEPPLLVEVPDQGVLWDMDHPQEHQDMERRWLGRPTPRPQEVEALLGPVLGVPAGVREHGRAVARVALALGRALLAAGGDMDLALLEAAALCHDLSKGQADHARAGAAVLRHWGWGPVALAVETHMDISPAAQGAPSAAELLYLADKLVEGQRLVGLEERFAAKLARHGADPVLAKAIQTRWHNASVIAGRLEQACGRPLGSMVEPIGQAPDK